MTTSPVIDARGLGRDHGGRPVVSDLDLQVAAGEVVGLLGPNGAGKTTTLRMLVGALAPTRGRLAVAGVDLLDTAPRGRPCIGWLPEDPDLPGDLGARALLDVVADLHGVAAAPRAGELLAALGLADLAQRPIGRLSRGQRQRVGLAAALLPSPVALVLDEPATGLDPGQRHVLRTTIRQAAEHGAAVVLSTHELAEVRATCDRVVVLAEGHVVHRADLAGEDAGTSVRVRVGRPEGLAAALADVPGVTTVEADGDSAVVEATHDVRADVARVAAAHDLLELTHDDLERVYTRAVGGAA